MTDSDSVNNTSVKIEERQRWLFFDYIRAIGIIIVIFIHGIVYHYGLVAEIDLENLNPFFMIIYLMLNWAGLFGLISAIVNSYSSFGRLRKNIDSNISHPSWKAFGQRWIFLGLFFLVLNFLYNFRNYLFG